MITTDPLNTTDTDAPMVSDVGIPRGEAAVGALTPVRGCHLVDLIGHAAAVMLVATMLALAGWLAGWLR